MTGVQRKSTGLSRPQPDLGKTYQLAANTVTFELLQCIAGIGIESSAWQQPWVTDQDPEADESLTMTHPGQQALTMIPLSCSCLASTRV